MMTLAIALACFIAYVAITAIAFEYVRRVNRSYAYDCDKPLDTAMAALWPLWGPVVLLGQAVWLAHRLMFKERQ